MNNKVKFLRGTSDEYAVAEKDSDAIYFTTDDGKLYIGDKEISGSDITIDDTLSDTSTNPVQNKVVKQAIDNKADKSLYGDTTINVGRKAGTTVGAYSTAEGRNTTASGLYSHTEGGNTTASGISSHAEGSNCSASQTSMPDRTVTISDVDYTIIGSNAYGINSHAEGAQSFAYGYSSHAEGYVTTASGYSSHAEGGSTIASGNYSHTSGYYTKALHDNEAAYGKYNVSNDNTLFSIGDGTADDARHNAFEITTTGGKLHDKDIATTDLIPTSFAQNAVLSTIEQVNDPDLESGIYSAENVSMSFSSDVASNWFMLIVNKHRASSGDGTQIAIPYDNGNQRGTFYRICRDGNWGNWIRIADGGNADTLDGLHADDFVTAANNQIQIPSNVDLPAWIYANGKRYQKYMTNNANTGTTNIPNNSTDWVWYWFDGINIFAREWATGKYYICDRINGGFSGWKDVYTSGYKPYVTGEVGGINGRFITNHGFLPSRVLIWSKGSEYGGGAIYAVTTFDESGFTIAAGAGVPAYDKYEYIIFR